MVMLFLFILTLGHFQVQALDLQKSPIVGVKVDIETNIVLIGGGIMSATLGVLLKELDPSLRMEVVERLSDLTGESSHAFNNAGTGHSALSELNYTPRLSDGRIEFSKALRINEDYE